MLIHGSGILWDMGSIITPVSHKELPLAPCQTRHCLRHRWAETLGLAAEKKVFRRMPSYGMAPFVFFPMMDPYYMVYFYGWVSQIIHFNRGFQVFHYFHHEILGYPSGWGNTHIPTWMVDLYGKCIGPYRYIFIPYMDPVDFATFVELFSTCYPLVN